MASAKEIRTQIKAIQNTGKITKAMEMVAASKMRKAQDRVVAARSYAEGVKRVVGNMMNAHAEYQHPFLVEREEIKKVGVIIVTTDKGLCGGLNTNALKAALGLMKEQTADIEVFTIGRRAGMFMRRVGAHISGVAENISDSPELSDILGVVTLAIEKYEAGELDAVHLVFSEFVNTMTQQPTVMRLMPCPVPENESTAGYWDYLYEPEAKEVLEGVLRRYVESLVYHAVLENKACEQSARMVAMKAATDNAKDIVKDLSITYNKARQAAITQELAEICAGAAAAG
ncbi:ATP synthase F1 subcomplex gamma subunit [Mariprofundus ferrinatatus]|uniref:ATP synthase gamma chain n=1 Tax=Mariprofundus ferrinatatus TaxID=1921087 RepID=A0A2K8L5Q3_9PROT|nr:F0F1 ATP synthase subunit gamma [Mariprofundus ferrinatatus]ATX82650.1 ATP synthase F1 subcomplex gamma subunit [Mariprofundus ferrinatatus]